MKTTLLALFLSALCLEAQTPSTAPPDPAGGTGAATRDEQLREAVRRRLAAGTNQPAPGAAAVVPAAIAPPANPVVSPSPATTVPPVAPSATVAASASTNSFGVTPPRPLPRPDSIIVPTTTAAPAGDTNGPGAIPPGTTLIPPPPGNTGGPPEEVLKAGMIDFRGADLTQVLALYAELVNRTVLRAATLPDPKIILKTQTDLTRREAVNALDAVLGINGITMINFGEKFVKADQVATANTDGAAFSRVMAKDLPEFGPYVTHVLQLRYAKPSELVPVLQPFAKIPNSILPIDSSQILVLRDFTENVKRMLELIKEIDVAVPSEFDQEVIPIKYALAADIAQALNSLSTSGGGGGSVGSSTPGGTRTPGRTTGSSSFNRQGGAGGTGSSYPGQPGGFGAQGSTVGGAAGGANPGGSFTDRLQNIIRRASVTGDIQVIGQTKIIADERTNSLLIFASRQDLKVIKDIIAKLDVVLAQVLIESAILQVSIGNTKDFGVSYLQQPKTAGNVTGVGSIGDTFYSPGDFIRSGGSNGPVFNGGFHYLAQFGGDLDVTLTAVATDSRAKILQRPRIQTSHAVPATLFVGQSRPYPTATYSGSAYGAGYSSIQQLQIGVTLEVTPLINPEGLVVMDIHQTIESFDGNVDIVNVGPVPVTSRKEASSKVAVRDHDTIILGGLMETDKSTSGSGVPVLMNIPILGYLFRSTSSSGNRQEIIVLIRPTVLKTPEIAAQTAMAEKEKMSAIIQYEREYSAEEEKRHQQLEKEKLAHPPTPGAIGQP